MKRLMWLVAGTAALSTVAAIALTIAVRPLASGALVYFATVPVSFLAAGVLLMVRHPANPSGWLLVAGTATTMSYAALLERVIVASPTRAGWMAPALAAETVLASVGLVWLSRLIAFFPFGTPTGRGEERFARALWVLPALMVLALVSSPLIPTDPLVYGGTDTFANPAHLSFLAPLGPALSGVRSLLGVGLVASFVVLCLRYRREGAVVRRQIRWVLFGAGTALTLGVFPYLVAPLLDPGGIVHGGGAQVVGTVALVLLPAAIFIGVAQPAWIDTDAVIRKTFAYGTLSIGIFVIYALVAAGAGVAAGARLPIEAAIVVTLVLAVVFHPARLQLQRVADRVVFGPRPTPMEAVATFDETFDGSDSERDLGPRLAGLVQRAVRVRWAEVELPPHGPFRAGPTSGEAVAVVPIERGGEVFGSIRCGPKPTGQFGTEDRNLVTALAGQTALLLANLRLAGRIVNAQEAERRRIERNLHDGAQQELVALVAKLGLARARAKSGTLDDATFLDLQSDAQTILRDLRDLAQGIHPSVLTDGGLVEAVEERCSRLPLDVAVRSSPEVRRRRFPDEIESAAYFFIAEGITNVLKHAAARSARVDIAASNGHLELRIADDGSGFGAETRPGSGLAGLADRFEALSGSLAVESRPGGGTVLRARLPIP